MVGTGKRVLRCPCSRSVSQTPEAETWGRMWAGLRGRSSAARRRAPESRPMPRTSGRAPLVTRSSAGSWELTPRPEDGPIWLLWEAKRRRALPVARLRGRTRPGANTTHGRNREGSQPCADYRRWRSMAATRPFPLVTPALCRGKDRRLGETSCRWDLCFRPLPLETAPQFLGAPNHRLQLFERATLIDKPRCLLNVIPKTFLHAS